MALQVMSFHILSVACCSMPNLWSRNIDKFWNSFLMKWYSLSNIRYINSLIQSLWLWTGRFYLLPLQKYSKFVKHHLSFPPPTHTHTLFSLVHLFPSSASVNTCKILSVVEASSYSKYSKTNYWCYLFLLFWFVLVFSFLFDNQHRPFKGRLLREKTNVVAVRVVLK